MSVRPYRGSNGDLGLIGPRGQRGPKGDTGRQLTQVELTYANITFQVLLEPSTIAIIEDEKALNTGDLDLIEVVNKEDWDAIRDAWCKAWQLKKAYRAFEMGDMEDESF